MATKYYRSCPENGTFPQVYITVEDGKIVRAHFEERSGGYNPSRGEGLFKEALSQCLYAMCGQNIDEFRKLMDEIKETDKESYSMGLEELNSRKQREIQKTESKYHL